MKYTEDRNLLERSDSLVMEGRDPAEKVAATRMDIGTDVNFGTLTRCMFDHLKHQPGVALHFSHQVRDLEKDEGETMWRLNVKNTVTGERRKLEAKFVFIGGGGLCHCLSNQKFPRERALVVSLLAANGSAAPILR